MNRLNEMTPATLEALKTVFELLKKNTVVYFEVAYYEPDTEEEHAEGVEFYKAAAEVFYNVLNKWSNNDIKDTFSEDEREIFGRIKQSFEF